MNIISWNVAGLRARLKNDETLNNSLMRALFSQVTNNGVGYKYFDIVCLQETKCTEEDVKLPCEITNRYPYRFWNSSKGTTQRKGFSGTTIWCTRPPINNTPTGDKNVCKNFGILAPSNLKPAGITYSDPPNEYLKSFTISHCLVPNNHISIPFQKPLPFVAIGIGFM